MVASPETNRYKGMKSRGTLTAQGKAIAAKNGILCYQTAKPPPMLVTKDLGKVILRHLYPLYN